MQKQQKFRFLTGGRVGIIIQELMKRVIFPSSGCAGMHLFSAGFTFCFSKLQL